MNENINYVWSKYGLNVLNIIHTYRCGNICLYVELGQNLSLDAIKSVTMDVAKVKPLMNSNMTLTVLNLHQKTPKGATTKIQVKRYERYKRDNIVSYIPVAR